MKKITGILLCILLLFSLTAQFVFADGEFSEGMYNDVSGSSIGRFSNFPWAAVIAMPIFIAGFIIYAKIKEKKNQKDKEQKK